MRRLFLTALIITSLTAIGQETAGDANIYINSAENMLMSKPGLAIGGYGEIHYNHLLKNGYYTQGTLDAHRLVMFLGYNFTSKTQLVSEIEFEYAKEIWIEQMFLQHKMNKYMNFRAGILLVPMGIINEYHEPTTFNGVERPVIDNKIAPTTWREIGVGFQGNVLQAKTRYQLYLINGFNGYDGTNALFSGTRALREGRQKGSKAYIQSPALTGKVEFYGASNLNIGVSGYFGKSHSRLYTNLDKQNQGLVQRADSSVVGISMVGVDARYNNSGLRITGQFYYTSVSNTREYNVFTAKNGNLNDLGSAMLGYYAEVGYNVFRPFAGIKTELMPFLRYEAYNTHLSVAEPVVKNIAYNNTVITTGLTYMLTRGAVLKADIQFQKSEADNEFTRIFNAGFGVMF